MIRNIIVVHIIPAHTVSDQLADACLDQAEKDRAARFKDSRHGQLWSGYRAALRIALGARLGLRPNLVPLRLDPHGKPCLCPPFDSLHFNLSHCDEMALIALSENGPIGIDLESRDRAQGLLECEAGFCHPQEIARLPEEGSQRAMSLLEIWTAKEACLKAIGTGLLTPPEQVRIVGSDDNFIAITPDGTTHALTRLEHPSLRNHVAHLCALQTIPGVEMVMTLPMEMHPLPSD
jgi:4'-phosphopantetheinyl transferase